MADLPGGLLDAVKAYLHITWQDTATDSNLTGYINRGMARLQQIAGAPLDFTIEGQPRALLLDYCRYANSQALEVFEQNFQSELLDLNLRMQAPVIDSLIVTIIPGAPAGSVCLAVSPAPAEGSAYLCRIGASLTAPARMDVCTSLDYVPWDGVSSIAAAAGQDVMILEINDEYEAVRAGKVTVS